jgi:magnesium-transporting ATPase (P-type)
MGPSPVSNGILWHAAPVHVTASLHVTDLKTGLTSSEAAFRHSVVAASPWRDALRHSRLCALAAEKAAVLRDGRPCELPVFELVPGDVISVREGDLAPADARLAVARELFCDESELTGRPVSGKSAREVAGDVPVAHQRSMIFCGSRVLLGSGRAIVVATGLETEIGRKLCAETEAGFGQNRTTRGELSLANAPE